MSDAWLLDSATLKRRLRERLDPVDAPETMDLTRMTRDPLEYEPEYFASLREAAVLAPIIDRPTGLSILLTLRTSDMPSHAGQISFPGGSRQPEDKDFAATALREAEEEIGLPPSRVTLLGKAPVVVIASGFRVTPIVGLVNPDGFEPIPSAREVAEVFEVPFTHFLNPANFSEQQREFRGKIRRFHAAPYGDRYVWGATASMLWTIQQRLNEVLDD